MKQTDEQKLHNENIILQATDSKEAIQGFWLSLNESVTQTLCTFQNL